MFKKLSITWALWLLWGLLCWAPSDRSHAADDSAYGPLLSHFPLTLDEGERTEALGPLFYEQQRGPEHTFAIPPFFTHVQNPDVDSEEYDFLYPALSFDRFGGEYRWHLGQLFSFAGGQPQGEASARRFTIFPIYFQQRSPDPDLNYTAVFPFYGHLKNRLFKDEIAFTAFPIYARTRKRAVITDNYFYPFYHKRSGTGLEGWQLWPFVGKEHKAITTRTNGFGELEVSSGHERFFAGWPFYSRQTDGLGTENPQQQLTALPFYASLRSPNRDSTSVLWPLVTWTDDREKKYREWDFPWPLMVIARGEGKTTTRYFPFYSHAQTTNLQSIFYLWPVYRHNRIQFDTFERNRMRILLFGYSRITETNSANGALRVRTDLWPFFIHRRDLSGNQRWQWLAPIEPILPNSKSIDRNWSPVWSVWRAEQNPKTGSSHQSLFWNTYRHEASPTARKTSLLFGLFQYQCDPDGSRTRLFFLTVKKTKNPAQADRPKPTVPIVDTAVDEMNDQQTARLASGQDRR